MYYSWKSRMIVVMKENAQSKENPANTSEWNSSSVYICATFVLLFKGKGYNRIQWIHDLERGLCLSCTVSKHVIISKQVCFLELLNLRTHNFPKLYLEFFYNVTFIWEAHIHLIVIDRAWWVNYIKIVQKCKYKSSRKNSFIIVPSKMSHVS